MKHFETVGLLLTAAMAIPASLCAGDREGLRLGGRISADSAWEIFAAHATNRNEVRRARLFCKGTFAKRFAYEAEYDFTRGGAWKDIALSYRISPHTNVAIGNMKEPFSLEALTSSKYNTFMERGLPNRLTEPRKVGMQFRTGYGTKRWFWHLETGYFTVPVEKVSQIGTTDSAALRTTLSYSGAMLWHVGASLGHTRYDDQKRKFSFRPESHPVTLKYLQTKLKHLQKSDRYGLEGVWQYGRISLQGEYIGTRFRTRKKVYKFSGWYLQTSCFLTGHKRRYKRKEAVFGRLKVSDKITSGGLGAWEAAVRLSHADMQKAGSLTTWTLGVNWYMTSHLRTMFEYVAIDTQTEKSSPNILQMRIAYDF